MTRFDMFSWLDKKKHDAVLTPAPAVIPNEPAQRDVPQPAEALTSAPASTPDVTSTPLNFAMPAATQSGQSTPEPIIPGPVMEESSQIQSELENGTAHDPIESDVNSGPVSPEANAVDEMVSETKSIGGVSDADVVEFDYLATVLGLDGASVRATARQSAALSESAENVNAQKEPSTPLPPPSPSLTPEQLAAAGVIAFDDLAGKITSGEALTPRPITPLEQQPVKTAEQLVEPRTIPFNDLAASLGLANSTSQPAPSVKPKTSDTANEPMLAINEHRHILEALNTRWREPMPTIGMPAFELAAPRLRAAKVVGVRAGGHTVTALIIDTNRSYTYALQKDGTYRLEGVPAKSAPRLLLNLEV